MLTSFIIKKQFNKTRVTLLVDCEAKSAEVVITHDRIIVRMEDVQFWHVCSIEKADAWLRRPCGERGNFVEVMDWSAAHGLLTAA